MLPIMPCPVRTRDQTRGGPCRLHRSMHSRLGTMATKIHCSGRWAGSRSISCTPGGGYSFFLWNKMAIAVSPSKEWKKSTGACTSLFPSILPVERWRAAFDLHLPVLLLHYYKKTSVFTRGAVGTT